jgi:ankyrin repeat protein
LSLTPYPNVFEIIRTIAILFDTKSNNKKLDELCNDPFADYRQLPLMLNEVIYLPLGKKISKLLAESVNSEVGALIDSYIYRVNQRNVGGISRDEFLPIITYQWFVPKVLQACNKVVLCSLPKLTRNSLRGVIKDKRCNVAAMISWIDSHYDGWGEYHSNLERKEEKDHLALWIRGEHTPGLSSIALLNDKDCKNVISKENWQVIKSALLIARALDKSESFSIGKRAVNLAGRLLDGDYLPNKLDSGIIHLQEQVMHEISKVKPHDKYLQQYMTRSCCKPSGSKRKARKHLDKFREILKDKGLEAEAGCYLEWQDATWHVLSGDLAGANKLYKQTMAQSIYRLGEDATKILKEALVVAAMCEDKVFLKKLKNYAVMFKADVASVYHDIDSDLSSKSDEFYKTWEVDLWKSQFDMAFPVKGLYPGVSYEATIKKTGPLIANPDDIKLDCRHENKKSKVGQTWEKSTPQINWFILHDKFEEFEKLVEKDARADVFSETGETPLIMALENLDVLAIPPRSLDDRFFELVLSMPNLEKIINHSSDKKKLTPIIQAIHTGRPDVVERLLSMGAKPDLRGATDDQTALNLTIKYMAGINNASGIKEQFEAQEITPEVLDSFRRETNGMYGASLEDQRKAMEFFRSDELMKTINDIVINKYSDAMSTQLSLNNLKDIVRLLLEAGANPNAEMTCPLRGYTPLMMASELDLVDELSLMLQCGGDLDKTYRCPKKDIAINSWQVAKNWKSKKVLRLMDDVRANYRQVH